MVFTRTVLLNNREREREREREGEREREMWLSGSCDWVRLRIFTDPLKYALLQSSANIRLCQHRRSFCRRRGDFGSRIRASSCRRILFQSIVVNRCTNFLQAGWGWRE